ncbi:hypothetical protein PRV_02495 [Mycoplasma parvum str. Indiana]|uniref:Uncharacterized protein n=1 Tax=Mycoplasma parvum str. Indiana TaxID=1403316 RepID=U5ND21_9MOLU|nr:hypothetical protein PRV_02495 [Mycoplasma parvum str. Indiana]
MSLNSCIFRYSNALFKVNVVFFGAPKGGPTALKCLEFLKTLFKTSLLNFYFEINCSPLKFNFPRKGDF